MAVTDKRTAAIRRELLAVERQEQKLAQGAGKSSPIPWRAALEAKVPAKVYTGLENAFAKGFSLVFQQGRTLIEKTYRKEDLQNDHAIRDYAVQLKGRRKELKHLQRGAIKSDSMNLAVTTLEGVGLGFLGVGMPDILLFLATLLRGIYETALNYGFDYETKQEQLLILNMMEASLSTGAAWVKKNQDVDALLHARSTEISDAQFQKQLQNTSAAFATDMLLLKFIQGIPVVGILGGAANPVYYQRVLRYVRLKYRKRYLEMQRTTISSC